MQKILPIHFFSILTISCVAFSCNKLSSDGKIQTNSGATSQDLTILPGSTSLVAGGAATTVEVIVKYISGSQESVTALANLGSSDESVLKISSANGVYYLNPGTKAGIATISANFKGKTAEYAFTVSDSNSIPDCTVDGQTNCIATATFKAVKVGNLSAQNLKSGVTIAGVSGTLADCAADAGVGCITTSNFKSASMASAVASNIKSGTTIAGTSGNVTPAAANCTSDGQGSCAVDGVSYLAVDMTNAVAANIKRGVTIAAVNGAFPSLANPLPRYSNGGASTSVSASGGITTSLTNFATQVTSAGNFEFWDANGQRYTASGDADIVNANVASGVAFENLSVSGSAAVLNPDPWDLRYGVSVGAVTGKLKMNCRNFGSTSTFDIGLPKSAVADNSTGQFTVTAHGFSTQDEVRISYSTAPTGLSNLTSYYVINLTANTFQLATSPANALVPTPVSFTGNGVNVSVFRWHNGSLENFNTVDDYNNGGSMLTTHPWSSSEYVCGGLEVTPGDANVWKDVTTGGCDATKCRYQDKISQLTWTKTISAGTTSWGGVLAQCDSLTFDGLTGWRLPTQKELMDAYNHGIYSVANANWISAAHMLNMFFSATTVSDTLSNDSYWGFYLAKGYSASSGKIYHTEYAACVRP